MPFSPFSCLIGIWLLGNRLAAACWLLVVDLSWIRYLSRGTSPRCRGLCAASFDGLSFLGDVAAARLLGIMYVDGSESLIFGKNTCPKPWNQPCQTTSRESRYINNMRAVNATLSCCAGTKTVNQNTIAVDNNGLQVGDV